MCMFVFIITIIITIIIIIIISIIIIHLVVNVCTYTRLPVLTAGATAPSTPGTLSTGARRQTQLHNA